MTMAAKKSTRTYRKQVNPADMDMISLIAAVKEAADAAPDQEAAKAMKKNMAQMFRNKIEELEAICEAEFEREMAQLRELRRNLPSAVANLTIGQIRDAGGFFGPDENGNVSFEIPAHLYRATKAEPTASEKSVVASAKKMIQQQQMHQSRTKRTRTVTGTPGSGVKPKIPKLQHMPVSGSIRQSVRQSTRNLRSTVKGGNRSENSSGNASVLFLSSTEETGNGCQKAKQARETQFEDALDGFASSQETAVKSKKKPASRQKDSSQSQASGGASAATGAATANTTASPFDDVQKQMLDMSIANPRTPKGKNRILSKPVRLPFANEAVVTIHVSKDGTPLLVNKKQSE